MADCDAARDKALLDIVDRGAKVVAAVQTFTCLETGLFVTNALKEKMAPTSVFALWARLTAAQWAGFIKESSMRRM